MDGYNLRLEDGIILHNISAIDESDVIMKMRIVDNEVFFDYYLKNKDFMTNDSMILLFTENIGEIINKIDNKHKFIVKEGKDCEVRYSYHTILESKIDMDVLVSYGNLRFKKYIRPLVKLILGHFGYSFLYTIYLSDIKKMLEHQISLDDDNSLITASRILDIYNMILNKERMIEEFHQICD